ncbi:MAG: hypothetical protein H6632_20125 [Anaerolineales bacterium]|nr:hypothetical protein [Anaerolineales bacterium]
MSNEPHELGLKPSLALPTPQTLSKRRILSLDEIEGADLALVGGKAFRLAQLRKYGFSVPPGLVLTTEFFKAQIMAAKLTPLWAGSPDIAVTAEALNWLADALKLKPLAPELSSEFESRLQQTYTPEVDSFAVRSSVIDEDHRDHSFAGMHLTELGVPRSALPIAITRCWASALSGPTVKYRQVHGLSIQSIRVALIIQPLLSPEIAGVAFTINPLTGARDEIIIEATWGLGNSLVAGHIQPYYYKIAAQPPDYPLIEQQAGIVPPVSAKTTRGDQPLTVTQIGELARQLEQIQALMGEPQDIEWAYQDHCFFFLQTRPAAVVPSAQSTQNREWTHHGYAQHLPPLPSPLFAAFLEAIQPQLTRFLTELGININHLAPLEKFILGRPYLNLTLIKAAITQVGLTSGSLLHLLGDTKAASAGALFTVDWKTAWAARAIYRSIWQQTRQLDDTLANVQAAINQTIANLSLPKAGLSSDLLLAQLRRQSQQYGHIKTVQLTLTLSRIILTGLGAKLLPTSIQPPITTLTTAAVQGADLFQERLHHRLVELGQWVQSQAVQIGQAQPGNFPESSVQSEEFKQKFTALLATYGHYATHDVDPGQPRYDEMPDTLLAMIAAHAQSKTGYESAEIKRAAELSQIPWWRQWLLHPLLTRLRKVLIKQDQLHENLVKFIMAVRQWHLALGQIWSAAGWLETPQDIFWLTLEEIERTLRVEEGLAVTLSSTIQARKETYDMYAKTTTPFVIKDTEVPAIQLGYGSSNGSGAADVFIGLPISPGQARGTVVVVRQPDEFNQIADNVILVMPSTDPAWLALLSSAAGLIVETGGLLSHGSVIAREYGLPAVANIPQATQRFHTGDKVLVDGSTGVIQLLERRPTSTP